ncbi:MULTISPECIES: endonuclease/exonuclease/phosphatase [unclassified Nocardioides]|uniref:endonuclease/exonuclease/phosphatase n=1 Tax=unclassified Nocardioides TaxID=2615069 RepID=UPI0000570439|nr:MULTISPECIES: endonuclease/exonuclease/phosphatase [unclassified Nocardioides]ABL79961.1 Endonuclease/exonuclease/phosphatase [Nocardioides sp. JS614]
MVRRVRLGRRDASRRARRWAGPPPLLLVATLIGFLVAPLVGHQPEPPPAARIAAHVTAPGARDSVLTASPTHPRAVADRPPRQRVLSAAPSRAGHAAGAGLRPVRLKRVHIGVASMNMYRKLSPAQAAHDARRLTRRPGLDVVGWQEADRFGRVLHSLPGWDTKTFPFGRRNSEIAVSWRRSEFALVSARQRQVAQGVSWRDGRYPFGNRMVGVVTLRHRDTGRLLTVVDAHLPQAIEDLSRPGRWTPTINAYRARNQLARIATTWRSAPGRWVVGTGDYNFDARADARHRPRGGPRRALADTAVSSYQALGADVAPTFPSNGRRIDYVYVDRAAYRAEQMRFTGQWVVGGFASDHNALVTRLVLS